ncbi:AMP-dependent synthetase/ligase [Nocardioides sp. 616]|uniref:AMP-dependent synthetase/ligase n=1 Tax=Nocardioides sp. 616 TaxID=2268090 RepID=UPI000CE48184|nr:AMP-dependent synthetase/ligase [Nocardioides sp. 616]
MMETKAFELLPLPETLTDAFDRMVGMRGDQTAVRSHDGRLSWTWGELSAKVDELAAGFHALGLRRGDKAALLLRNRPEFYPIDLALVRLGVVPFSLYATSSPEQQAHALADSGATLVVAEPALMGTIASVDLPERRVQLEGDLLPGWSSIDSVVEAGRGTEVSEVARPQADDLLTLIYTSGTTGVPKGVMISHRNFLATAEATLEAQRIPEGSVVVSWLPSAHVGERLGGYVIALVQGWEIVTVDDPRQVISALQEIHPHYFFAPPRIFEKLRASFDTWLLGLDGPERADAEKALADSQQRVDLEQAQQPVPQELMEASIRAREELFMPWKRSVGLDQLTVAVVATAPNPGPLMSFYHSIGIPMGEAYGLSESGASGTASYPGSIRIGTVGQVSRNMELKIAEDGEILLRGPAVMVGYLNLPQATADVIDPEGWLHTGDLGALDEDGYLRVVGRKKEILISSSGKNIAPVTVESAILSASPFIGQVCCFGDARPYTVALIVLDTEYVTGWAKQQGIADISLAALADDERVRAQVAAGVEAGNARLNRPEQIKKFHIVAGEWLPGRELTPTSKMRRGQIASLYNDVIEELYT